MSKAPEYIAADEYKGLWTATRFGEGYRGVSMRAGTLAAESSEGVLWEGHPTPKGSKADEMFGRSRYVADEKGNLHIYASDGHKVIIHPADRVIRVLRNFS